MESRRKRNLEIERKKRQRQRIFTWILSAGIFVAIVALGYAVWDIQNRRTILTFEGTRISMNDFRYFYSVMNPLATEEETKAAALENLLYTLTLINRAESHGFSATSEEMAGLIEEAVSQREEWLNYMPGGLNFISAKRIAELSAPWGTIMESLMDEYLPDYEPDEDELNEYLESQREQTEIYASEMNLKYISSYEYNDLLLARLAFTNGEAAFDDLIREHDIFYSSDGGEIEAIDFYEFFTATGVDWSYADAVSELLEGEVSEIMVNEDGIYFIALMVEKTIDQEMFDSYMDYYREQFISGERTTLFWEIVEQWYEEAKYSLNQRAFDRF